MSGDHRNANRATPALFGSAGWLFADLLLALALVFLVANSVGQADVPPVATPTHIISATPTATPSICGMEQQPGLHTIITVVGEAALRANDTTAVGAFARQAHEVLAPFSTRSAGLVEVYGGSYRGNFDVADGTALANGAITGLKSLGESGFVFPPQKTLFQPFWSGTLASNEVEMYVFFFRESTGSGCIT